MGNTKQLPVVKKIQLRKRRWNGHTHLETPQHYQTITIMKPKEAVKQEVLQMVYPRNTWQRDMRHR